MLHNSHEFLPFVIYLRAPPIEEDPDEIIEENGRKNSAKSTNSSKCSSKEGSMNALIATNNGGISAKPMVCGHFKQRVMT